MAVRTLVVASTCALLWASSVAAHSGIPRAWWLDEQTALTKLRAVVKTRYSPSVSKTFSGRCNGLAPTATRTGSRVYKHFSCWGRVRAGGVGFTFYYLVHVTGRRGRISVGG